MYTQARAIVLICVLIGSSIANLLLEGKGTDEISGYIFSPIIGLSKIQLSRKFRRQVNWHVPVIPYVETKEKLSPISENYFEIEDDDDGIEGTGHKS
ncbi:hypothetical protein AVEN_114785-1 [Araneus ventricosus]|uniref:Uncharacterized protein n=1 Tax=Araneus ventricosus TaxID=182803 RepID=A0A4Y2KDW0_ARAVE|nr:hypothetical protein AVEN_114785-1 [Araneus ventricosus]